MAHLVLTTLVSVSKLQAKEEAYNVRLFLRLEIKLMYHTSLVIILLLSCSYSPLTIADVQKANTELAISGLLLDETVSRAGHDFYDLLSTRLQSMDLGHNITVSERNNLGRSIVTVIMDDDNKVLESVLNPRSDAIEELTDQTVANILQAIIEEEFVSKELGGL
jgi:curli production assembly/transport component CsgE